MIKGLYAAASAMLVGMNRQQVLTHNIANVDTPGFKQVMLTMDEFVQTAVVQPPRTASMSSRLSQVGVMGLGVENRPEENDFTQGGLKMTSQPLDFAIQGAGFFRVQTPEGERYTRDGRFLQDDAGRLVTVDGYFVLDSNGQPIELEEGTLAVLGDGTLLVNGEPGVQLGLAAFADPAAELTPGPANTFSAAGGPTSDELGVVQQGVLEMSNANPSELMTQLVLVARSYEAAQKMVQNQDTLLGQAIQTLGRW